MNKTILLVVTCALAACVTDLDDTPDLATRYGASSHAPSSDGPSSHGWATCTSHSSGHCTGGGKGDGGSDNGANACSETADVYCDCDGDGYQFLWAVDATLAYSGTGIKTCTPDALYSERYCPAGYDDDPDGYCYAYVSGSSNPPGYIDCADLDAAIQECHDQEPLP